MDLNYRSIQKLLTNEFTKISLSIILHTMKVFTVLTITIITGQLTVDKHVIGVGHTLSLCCPGCTVLTQVMAFTYIKYII